MHPVRKRILIVEDEPDLRDLLRWTLARSDFEIAVAADGESAIQTARAAAPDLVLLDLMLPRLDGFQVCRQLRAFPETSGVPVLVVSAIASPDAQDRSRACGANGYIAKPFSVRHLVQRIDQALAGQPAALFPNRHGTAIRSSSNATIITSTADEEDIDPHGGIR